MIKSVVSPWIEILATLSLAFQEENQVLFQSGFPLEEDKVQVTRANVITIILHQCRIITCFHVNR